MKCIKELATNQFYIGVNLEFNALPWSMILGFFVNHGVGVTKISYTLLDWLTTHQNTAESLQDHSMVWLPDGSGMN